MAYLTRNQMNEFKQSPVKDTVKVQLATALLHAAAAEWGFPLDGQWSAVRPCSPGGYYTHCLPSYTYLLMGSGVPFGLALQEATTPIDSW